MDGVELAWFDHWLKGIDTGITDTTTPLHLEDLATGKYVDASRYPLNQATPTTYYLQPHSGLETSAPTGSPNPDLLAFTGTQIPCTNSTEQWAAGLGVLALGLFGITDPCTQNDVLSQLGPGTQTYTTAPFKTATTLAGPIGATLYATSTTTDTEWVVQISDVAPGRHFEAADLRPARGRPARDRSEPDLVRRQWRSAAPVPSVHPGLGDSGRSGQGDALRHRGVPDVRHARARSSAARDDRHLGLPACLARAVLQIPHLLGGVYNLEHSAAYPSSVELPLARAGVVHDHGEDGAGLPRAEREAGRRRARPGQARRHARSGPQRAAVQLEPRTPVHGLLLLWRAAASGSDMPSPKLLRTVPRSQRAPLQRPCRPDPHRQPPLHSPRHPARITGNQATRKAVQGRAQHLVPDRERREPRDRQDAPRPDRGARESRTRR